MKKENEHISCPSHCCIKHGCKYSYRDCPVSTGQVRQDGPCEDCGLESEGYYGDSPQPIDYHMYLRPGVMRKRTPAERLEALESFYYSLIPDDDAEPVDLDVLAALTSLRGKYPGP